MAEPLTGCVFRRKFAPPFLLGILAPHGLIVVLLVRFPILLGAAIAAFHISVLAILHGVSPCSNGFNKT
jgi:hypothetical protein